MIDLLEMVVEPLQEDADGQEILRGLREIVQQVFKDTETLQIDISTVYKAVEKLNIAGKEQILQLLKKIERDGKFSRTRMDDLIHNLEEVGPS